MTVQNINKAGSYESPAMKESEKFSISKRVILFWNMREATYYDKMISLFLMKYNFKNEKKRKWKTKSEYKYVKTCCKYY